MYHFLFDIQLVLLLTDIGVGGGGRGGRKIYPMMNVCQANTCFVVTFFVQVRSSKLCMIIFSTELTSHFHYSFGGLDLISRSKWCQKGKSTW